MASFSVRTNTETGMSGLAINLDFRPIQLGDYLPDFYKLRWIACDNMPRLYVAHNYCTRTHYGAFTHGDTWPYKCICANPGLVTNFDWRFLQR